MIFDCLQFFFSPASNNKKMCETKTFTLWLLNLVALLGLLAFFLWLSMRPKDPSYTFIGLSVPVSGNGTDQNSQNSSLSFILEIENPNKDYNVFYDNVLLSFGYNNEAVGEKTIHSFSQGKDNTIQIIDHVDVNARMWTPVLNGISNKTAELRVGLMTRIRYRAWWIKTKSHGMNLQGLVPIGSDGKISGKKKQIKLHRASKKLRVKFT